MDNTTKKRQAKYPCRNCIYKERCGDPSRNVPCYGRVTKSQLKGR